MFCWSTIYEWFIVQHVRKSHSNKNTKTGGGITLFFLDSDFGKQIVHQKFNLILDNDKAKGKKAVGDSCFFSVVRLNAC